jgi:hypothetical protein
MKPFFILSLVLITVVVPFMKVSAEGNTFTEIYAFKDEEGQSRLLLRYDFTGVFGAFNLRRAVDPNGPWMPMAPGEVLESYFDGNTVVWILDLDKLGKRRVFRIEVTP